MDIVTKKRILAMTMEWEPSIGKLVRHGSGRVGKVLSLSGYFGKKTFIGVELGAGYVEDWEKVKVEPASWVDAKKYVPRDKCMVVIMNQRHNGCKTYRTDIYDSEYSYVHLNKMATESKETRWLIIPPLPKSEGE